MSVIKRFCAVAALCIVHSAFAAEPLTPLGLSVVTATRSPTDVDEVLAPIIVIGREELERSLAPDIASLLQMHAGIDIGRNGGPGQTTAIFIRGTDSNHSTVLLDGVRINPGTIGGAQIQNINPETVERIEIVKGPRSSLYGSDAIGGVINVITRDFTGTHLGASAGFGRYNTRQAALNGGFGGELGQLSFSAVGYDSDGFPARTDDDSERGFENRSASIRGRTQLGAVELGARFWHASGTSEYSDFFLTPVDQDFENTVAAIELGFSPLTRWRSKFTASRMEDEIRQNQAEDWLRTRRKAFDWQNDIQLAEHHLLTAGALLTREDTGTLAFGSGFDVSTEVNQYFVQDRVDFGRHKLLLAVGYTDHETFGTATTWNAEYGVDLVAGTRLIAAAGTAFRAPDSTDRFGFGGNPALDPERSRNYELRLQQKIGLRQQLSLSAFRNRIDDLIEFVVTDPLTFDGRNENVEQARIEGVEASYEYRGDSWWLRAEAISQEPRNLSTDAQLLRRARDSLTVSGLKSFGRFEFGFDLLTTGPRKDFGFPAPIKLSGYTLFSLSGRVAITEAWSLQARLDNVTDRQYELANGYNTPDRSLFVATRYEFK